MLYLSIILFILVGIYLVASGINMFLKENKKDKKWWYYIIGILEVILDIISDPITSVGFRIFFGGLFILAGLLLLLL
ncbi:hypothetical protein [Heyndrickxia oleronia]|uniref:hypothetical protein n=1 Tax=Heyndrickxia oleronia TaxID=38875 RepID=UPI001C0F0466|nr:hypothetical protein [Heyndrickxia oleronia]MBU5211936.1 hypothetical protein [Heyndrickxia oleronia]